MGFHKNLNGDDVHVVHAYTYADATARGAATGFTSADVGKVAWQQDTDVLYLLTDDSPITWVAIGSGGGGSGDVVGPASATDNAIARYDGTTGKLIQNSGASVDDSGNITANNLSGTNTGDQTISLTGDVTGSGTGSFAATIANDAVTFAKMQNIATSRLLGRSTASSGDIEELTIGTGLSLSGGVLSNTVTDTGITELTGDVTAGPGSGSQAATLATVNSNVGSFTNGSFTVNAKGLITAASSGSAPVTSVGATSPITSSGGATPTISTSMATNKLIGRYTSGSGVMEEVSLGNNLSYTNSTLNAASYLKEHVDVATIAALTVTSSGSGIGQTLTNSGAQAALVIDGVTMAVNDRVLVKDQANSENGIYVVTDIGSVSTNWVLTRATDADGSDAGQVSEGMQVTALRGSQARIIYILTTANPITVGSTTLTFEANNAGGVSGSGTANRIAYFDSSGVLTTTSFLDVDSTDKTLRHYQSAATGNTVINGLALTNDTSATSGNQQYSGALYWKGNGWKTNAGGASQTCEYRSYVLPVQGTVSPECTLTFEGNLNSAGWVSLMQIRNASGGNQALFEFGNVSFPGMSYRVDSDTGIRRSGVNAQALVCGGTDIAGVDVNGFCVGTLGMNNANFGVHPTTTTKHGSVWRSRNSISVDYFNFQNDSATQEASLFRTSGTSGDWKWRMTGGTAALPSYSFYSDTDTGMYSQAANAIGFAVNGAETFRMSQGLQRTSYDGSNHMEITVSSSGLVNLTATGASGAFYFQNHIYMQDAKDFSFSGTTGTKFGQGTTEKIGFWNQTPTTQPNSTGETTGFTAGAGAAVDSAATFTGNVGTKAYTLNDVVKHLKNIGLLAAS